jgi:hypothetical protein
MSEGVVVFVCVFVTCFRFCFGFGFGFGFVAVMWFLTLRVH